MPYSQGSQNHSVARLFIYRDGVPVAVAPSGYRSDAEQIEDIAELVRRANAFDTLTQETISLRNIAADLRRQLTKLREDLDQHGF